MDCLRCAKPVRTGKGRQPGPVPAPVRARVNFSEDPPEETPHQSDAPIMRIMVANPYVCWQPYWQPLKSAQRKQSNQPPRLLFQAVGHEPHDGRGQAVVVG